MPVIHWPARIILIIIVYSGSIIWLASTVNQPDNEFLFSKRLKVVAPRGAVLKSRARAEVLKAARENPVWPTCAMTTARDNAPVIQTNEPNKKKLHRAARSRKAYEINIKREHRVCKSLNQA